MRQPPEKVDVARSDAASSNPRPWRILEARAGAPAASMACNRAPMAPRRAAPSPVSAPAAPPAAASKDASSASNSSRSPSTASTASSTVVSSPGSSCSTCKIWRLAGIPLICRAAIARSSVDLPAPLRPMRPYRRPEARSSDWEEGKGWW